MRQVVIVGCGNIGYRHFEAACQTAGIDQIVVVEPNPAQLAKVRNEPRVVAFESIDAALAEAPGPECVVSALTTDVQMALMPKLLGFRAAHYLLEKPLAQGPIALDTLVRAIDESAVPSKVFVNCSRNLWDGYQRVREWMAADGVRTRFHIDVVGNLWGFGCNTVHFLELFRFLTGASRIEPITTQVARSPYGNKRGPKYEEFVGSASFVNEHGDTIQVTSGAASDRPSGIYVAFKEKAGDRLRFILEENQTIVVDVAEGKRIPFEALRVSKTTTQILEVMLQGRSGQLLIPNLEQAALVHAALFEGLKLATGREEFAIT